MSSKIQKWLSHADEVAIIQAIRDSELKTSGEIRVHIESTCKSEDPRDRAVDVFFELGMQKTKAGNGILIYISVKDRKLAIIGDKGIHQYVGAQFWEEIRLEITAQILRSGLAEGICTGIRLATEILSHHFPYQAGDINELPDDISVSE